MGKFTEELDNTIDLMKEPVLEPVKSTNTITQKLSQKFRTLSKKKKGGEGVANQAYLSQTPANVTIPSTYGTILGTIMSQDEDSTVQWPRSKDALETFSGELSSAIEVISSSEEPEDCTTYRLAPVAEATTAEEESTDE